MGLSWFAENWALILGGGSLSTALGWFFGGKQAKELEIKKGESDIKKGNSDAVASMQIVYDQFLSDYKERMNEVMLELTGMKEHNKQLQSQFNDIQLSYAKEVEKSQNWEKLHRELNDKYVSLEKDHDSLKVLYEKLKSDFDKYKKTTK